MSALRVLHVDDEPDIREVVELALGLDPEMSVRSCGSGQDGLTAANEWTPDLILLDVMMPVMDGPATLANLRGQPETAGIPVVFMTARAQPRELEHFVSLGAEGVIAKPFDPMTLAASVRNYAGGVEASIAGRRENFIKRARANAEQLVEHRLALGDPEAAAAALGRIRTLAHSIAGGAGIFGLAEMSGDASVLETAAIERIEGKAADVEAALDALVARIENT
jgi:CheY-like chemotaxis protein/HPt (histidine-containing phosphotransfer) domain-containing protein